MATLNVLLIAPSQVGLQRKIDWMGTFNVRFLLLSTYT